MLTFAQNHRAITSRLDQLQADLDAWREGLIACDPTAALSRLVDFAADATEIASLALALPRSGTVRGLADSLIQAAQAEDAAMGSLRDGWRPNDPTVFDEFESSRTAAIQVQKEVQDDAQTLLDDSSATARDETGAFSEAFDQLTADLDRFHADYDEFRSAALSSAETIDSLNGLVIRFRGIMSAVRDLPTTPLTRPIVDILLSAAEEEATVLRRLRETFREGAPAQFEAFSSQVTLSARELRRAKELLADIVANTSQATNDAVTQFSAGYQALLQRWDTFHKQYDQWRSTEGGCDRAEAAQTLGGFAIRSGDLAATARSLPPLTLLRPLVELLVEAVEREEEALRQLRNTWVPFDGTVYAIYDSQRSEASELRRQVASGLASLLANHGISAEEIPNRSSE